MLDFEVLSELFTLQVYILLKHSKSIYNRIQPIIIGTDCTKQGLLRGEVACCPSNTPVNPLSVIRRELNPSTWNLHRSSIQCNGTYLACHVVHYLPTAIFPVQTNEFRSLFVVSRPVDLGYMYRSGGLVDIEQLSQIPGVNTQSDNL